MVMKKLKKSYNIMLHLKRKRLRLYCGITTVQKKENHNKNVRTAFTSLIGLKDARQASQCRMKWKDILSFGRFPQQGKRFSRRLSM
jgi:ABC-type enterochelin transport system ATPase subunit